jgi:hypothetical protein
MVVNSNRQALSEGLSFSGVNISVMAKAYHTKTSRQAFPVNSPQIEGQ